MLRTVSLQKVASRTFTRRVESSLVRAKHTLVYSGIVGTSPLTTKLSHVPKKTLLRRFSSDLPKYQEWGLPALSPTMERGNLSKWRKKEGDEIKPGDVLAEIETDKATVDWEATENGFLAKILFVEGTKDIPVGKAVAVVVSKKEHVAAFANFKSSGDAPKPAAKQEAPAAAKPQQAAPAAPAAAPAAPKATPPVTNLPPGAPPPPPTGGRVLASPAAKAVAREAGIPLNGIQGSGPNQRILKSDVLQAASSAPAAAPATSAAAEVRIAGPEAPYVDIPNSQIRKVTAQRLTMSKQTAPHYHLTIDCNVDELVKLRARLNEKANGAYKLSVNDFVLKAAALALKKVPVCNSSWNDEFIRRFNYVDICVAVNTEKGLFTPFIKDTDKKGLAAINQAVKDFAERAKIGRLTPAELSGGTFTVSNLGGFGIKQFTAVINPPQACILAVGGTEKRVVVNEKATGKDDQFVVKNVMTVTLNCDHRVVDGAIGAEYMAAFKELIEDPVKMLL